MSMAKGSRRSFVAGFALLTLAGTGGALSGCSSAQGSVVDYGDLDTVRSGYLTVASDLEFPPLIFQDDDRIIGFEPDLIDQIASRLGLKVDYLVADGFEAIEPMVREGRADIGASGLSITAERQAGAAMTKAYLESSQALLVRSKDAGLGLEDMGTPERVVVTQGSTTSEEWVRHNLPEATVVTADDPTEALAGLQAGLYDGAVIDTPVARYLSNNIFNAVVVAEVIPTGERYGFVVNRDNGRLADALDEQISLLGDEGVLASLQTKWFGGEI